MLKPTLIAMALLTPASTALAQQAPDAGQQIQQIPQPPIVERSGLDLKIDRAATPAPDAPEGPRIRVNSIQVTGATLFSDTELIAATDFRPGSDLTLAELRALAAQVAHHYNRAGYFLAQAYLPAQNVQSGIVTIAVVEGRYGAIDLRNQSGLSDRVAHGVLAGLDSGDVVATARSNGACFSSPIFQASTSARHSRPVPRSERPT